MDKASAYEAEDSEFEPQQGLEYFVVVILVADIGLNPDRLATSSCEKIKAIIRANRCANGTEQVQCPEVHYSFLLQILPAGTTQSMYMAERHQEMVK